MRFLFSLAFLLATLSCSSIAHAKRIDKMTDDAVRHALENDKNPERRAQAATVLGDRGVQSATVRLGARCGMDPVVAVCVAAVDALATLGSPGALDQVREVLVRDKAPPLGRRRALAVLVEKDPPRVVNELPELFARYRPMDPELLTELLVATRLLEAGQLADAMVFIASDDQLTLPPRVAALDAAEYFAPPRLHEAHMALLKARDSKVRVRCAEGLGGPSLPATQIIPMLQEVVRKDPEGYVRTAALGALAHYAHPGLLPLLEHFLTPMALVIVQKHFSTYTLLDSLQSGPMRWEQVATIFTPIVGALRELHAQEVFHRYIDPRCVLVSQSEPARGKLTGFFGASVVSRSTLGAPKYDDEYGAPERGEPGAGTGMSDAYSVARCIIAALTGFPTSPPDAPGLPPGAARALQDMTAHEPRDRQAAWDALPGLLDASSDARLLL